jgi:N-acetylglucosamine kinase-like BadF-type ATPase
VRALGLALRSRDGRGDPTSLATSVPAHFGMDDPESLLTAVYTGSIEYGRLFELAKLCLDAAADGDPPARDAVAFLANEVVLMINATVARLDAGPEPVEVVLGGGLFETTHSVLTEMVESGVRAATAHVRFRRLEGPPVLGAALLGLDAEAVDAGAEVALRAGAPAAEPIGG